VAIFLKILLLIFSILIIPSVCSAHSGNLINAFSNYLPFIVPFIAGAVATCKNFFAQFFARFTKFFARFKKK